MRTIILPDEKTEIPVLGQGTWLTFEHKNVRFEQEKAALLAGIEAGMTLIDTAEMYGESMTETLVGQALQGLPREKLFLVSKIYPYNAGVQNIFKSCTASLRRLQTDYLDLYLVHWRGQIPLAETVYCMENLKTEGLIRRWGVSNFDTDDMRELWETNDGCNCTVNQVLYNAGSRGIEYDLLPWMRAHDVFLMAYCPLGHGGAFQRDLLKNAALQRLALKHQVSVAQILLAFAIRDSASIAIPCSRQKAHTLDNAAAATIKLDADDLLVIDAEFPSPRHKIPLDIL